MRRGLPATEKRREKLVEGQLTQVCVGNIGGLLCWSLDQTQARRETVKFQLYKMNKLLRCAAQHGAYS